MVKGQEALNRVHPVHWGGHSISKSLLKMRHCFLPAPFSQENTSPVWAKPGLRPDLTDSGEGTKNSLQGIGKPWGHLSARKLH